MTGKRDSFSKRDVTVTLAGEQWLAVLSHIYGQQLSTKAAKIYDAAAIKIQAQVWPAICADLQVDEMRGASIATAAADEVPGIKSRASLHQEGGEQ